jgi:hypothetical protein
VADFVEAPLPADPYTQLQARLLAAHQLTDYQKVEFIKKMPSLGAQKPSGLFAEMLRVCPKGQEGNSFFIHKFLSRLPKDLRLMPSGMDFADRWALADRADELWTHTAKQHHDVVAAVADEEQAAHVTAVSRRGGQGSRANNKPPPSSKKAPWKGKQQVDQKALDDSGLCYYHFMASSSTPTPWRSSQRPPTIPPAYRDLLVDFQDVLNPTGDLPPPTHEVEHHLITKGRPVSTRFRRLDPEKHEAARDAFAKLEKQGIIRRSNSCWASPLLMVRKTDGSWRPFGDFRQLNLITEPDKYPLPRMDDPAGRLKGCNIFTKLDLKQGYQQIPMAAADMKKTACSSLSACRLDWGTRASPSSDILGASGTTLRISNTFDRCWSGYERRVWFSTSRSAPLRSLLWISWATTYQRRGPHLYGVTSPPSRSSRCRQPSRSYRDSWEW